MWPQFLTYQFCEFYLISPIYYHRHFFLHQIFQHLYSESLKTHLGKILEPKITIFYREIPIDLNKNPAFLRPRRPKASPQRLAKDWSCGSNVVEL